MKIDIHEPARKEYGAWIGGSILGKLYSSQFSSSSFWLTREEFMERGEDQ